MVEINGQVRQQYMELSDQFSDMVTKILASLKNHAATAADSLSNFIPYLAAKRCNTMIGFCLEQSSAKDPSDWTEMFNSLSATRAWDCLNYRLLKTIMDRYLFTSSDYAQLKKEMEDHDKKVKSFLQHTLLLEFLDIYKEEFPIESEISTGCRSLRVKFVGKLKKMTLADFHAQRGYILRELKLHHYVLSLANVNSGCVVLYWYIKEECVEHVKKICQELQPDFGQAGVIEMCIDDYVLYQVSDPRMQK